MKNTKPRMSKSKHERNQTKEKEKHNNVSKQQSSKGTKHHANIEKEKHWNQTILHGHRLILQENNGKPMQWEY